MELIFKQGDTHNAIQSTLIKNDEPIDLTDCKVYITVSDVTFEDECFIVDAKNGKVAYPVGRISQEPKNNRYEYVIKYSDGTKEIVPYEGYKRIKFYERLKE